MSVGNVYDHMAAAVSGIAAELRTEVNKKSDQPIGSRFAHFADRLTALVTNPHAESRADSANDAATGDPAGGSPVGASSTDAAAGAPAARGASTGNGDTSDSTRTGNRRDSNT